MCVCVYAEWVGEMDGWRAREEERTDGGGLEEAREGDGARGGAEERVGDLFLLLLLFWWVGV